MGVASECTLGGGLQRVSIEFEEKRKNTVFPDDSQSEKVGISTNDANSYFLDR